MTQDRRQTARAIRIEAAEAAYNRHHPEHKANGDEQAYASASYPMSFTKGLAHDKKTGLVADPLHFEAFRSAIDNGFIDPFTSAVPVPAPDKGLGRRKWEAPTAGVVYELEGPDPQAVTMAPAPALGSDELAFEMAEVYELGILHDADLNAFRNGGGAALNDSIKRLNDLPYVASGFEGGRDRKTDDSGKLDKQTVFRGSSPGVEAGGYLSQFMLIGNVDQTGNDGVEDGRITYGALQIDQRVPVATTTNWMTKWDDWFQVQQGNDVRNNATLFDATAKRRFITTPRDMATYVHDDALYEAYLNAALILLSMGTPFDPAFNALSGGGTLYDTRPNFTQEKLERQAGGFALYGGPHILTLVCEVATRGLKAVRFQKFNNHIRLRPEALAARIEKDRTFDANGHLKKPKTPINDAHPSLCDAFIDLATAIKPTVQAVIAKNTADNPGDAKHRTALLPMAFQEGSPMHPAYGAGHATVAGACVTMLKAFFDTGTVFVKTTAPGFPRKNGAKVAYVFKRFDPKTDTPVEFVVQPGKDQLKEKEIDCPLTLEGELNKLAANISIGRNMGGVHYYSDYFDSLRMGEEITIGILEEQALGYRTDPCVMSVPTFDGPVRRIGKR
ncbi:MAG: bromoperoxidase [Pseudomonadota bacterium]